MLLLSAVSPHMYLYRCSICFCLHQSFVEKQHFFENYEALFQSLKLSAEAFVNADSSGEKSPLIHTLFLTASFLFFLTYNC